MAAGPVSKFGWKTRRRDREEGKIKRCETDKDKQRCFWHICLSSLCPPFYESLYWLLCLDRSEEIEFWDRKKSILGSLNSDYTLTTHSYPPPCFLHSFYGPSNGHLVKAEKNKGLLNRLVFMFSTWKFVALALPGCFSLQQRCGGWSRGSGCDKTWPPSPFWCFHHLFQSRGSALYMPHPSSESPCSPGFYINRDVICADYFSILSCLQM